jgi:hypothetical protein
MKGKSKLHKTENFQWIYLLIYENKFRLNENWDFKELQKYQFPPNWSI